LVGENENWMTHPLFKNKEKRKNCENKTNRTFVHEQKNLNGI
jgi:hypothetical protein